jgi:hypothetical protein
MLQSAFDTIVVGEIPEVLVDGSTSIHQDKLAV